jgi:hypothetical protein
VRFYLFSCACTADWPPKVCAAAFITVQHQVNVHTSIFSTTVTQWTEAFLAASLVTTAICTCEFSRFFHPTTRSLTVSLVLIVFKLWNIQTGLRHSGAYDDSRSLTRRVLKIFIESAALYSINNLMYSVLYSVKLNPEAWFSGLVRVDVLSTSENILT